MEKFTYKQCLTGCKWKNLNTSMSEIFWRFLILNLRKARYSFPRENPKFNPRAPNGWNQAMPGSHGVGGRVSLVLCGMCILSGWVDFSATTLHILIDGHIIGTRLPGTTSSRRSASSPWQRLTSAQITKGIFEFGIPLLD